MRILHVAAEVHPLVKTGGLADVLGSLPVVQQAQGHRVAVLVPGLPAVMQAAGPLNSLPTADCERIGARLLRGRLAEDVELLVIDQPDLYDRPGGPYGDANGNEWPDNHLRYALLGRIGAALCRRFQDIDVLHAHDWHAGLAPAYLKAEASTCASCFTIHNLAYQGRYTSDLYATTGLPWSLYRFDGLEYHGDWSFMKAGLAYSDAITTVSPTYAREILQPEAGMGLHDLLNFRRRDLHGILNGVDYRIWDPATDAALTENYSIEAPAAKRINKKILQQASGLVVDSKRMLVGLVSRLTTHKGIDLVPEALEPLLAGNRLQLVLLGSGDASLERALLRLARRYPDNCAVTIGYDEIRAHRIFGGADAILVPSRFEPCGLTQMYGLRYAALPIVRNTGGLADTVIGYQPAGRARANGFVFNTASALALQRVLNRALKLYRDRAAWKLLMHNAMSCEFGWDRAARAYVDLYTRLLTR